MSSIRHTPRQSSRDLRLHEPHALHPLPHHPPPPPMPHLNGNGVVPTTPASIPNGAPHPHPTSHVSPKGSAGLAPSASRSIPPSIQKLVDANEQTWLVIGPLYFYLSFLPYLGYGHLSLFLEQAALLNKWEIWSMRQMPMRMRCAIIPCQSQV